MHPDTAKKHRFMLLIQRVFEDSPLVLLGTRTAVTQAPRYHPVFMSQRSPSPLPHSFFHHFLFF